MNKTMKNVFGNKFVEKLRAENIYDENEYKALVEELEKLSIVLKQGGCQF